MTDTTTTSTATLGVVNLIQEVRVFQSSLDKGKQWIVFEVGGCLVKVLYLPKNANLQEPEEEYCTLHCKTFARKALEEAVLWVKEEAFRCSPEEDKKYTVLGRISSDEFSLIISLLGESVEQVQPARGSMTTLCQGFSHMLKTMPVTSFCHEPPNIPPMFDFKNSFKALETMREAVKQDFASFATEEDSKLPCLFAHYGTYGYAAILRSDGTHEPVHFDPHVGRYFRGLSQALFGIREYSKVCELAANGFRGNVDTQIKDVFPLNDENSPYGAFPPDLPIMNFGKLADVDELNLQTAKQEDMANSLVASLSNGVLQHLLGLCHLHRVSRVFLSGPMFQSEIFRFCLLSVLVFWGMGLVELNIVNAMYIEALASLLTTSSNAKSEG